jgi:hypothetical protein
MNTTNTDLLDLVFHIEGLHATPAAFLGLTYPSPSILPVVRGFVACFVWSALSPSAKQHVPTPGINSTYLPTTARRRPAVFPPPVHRLQAIWVIVVVIESQSESGCHRFVLV